MLAAVRKTEFPTTMGDELPAGQSIRQATWAVGENWMGGRASAEAIPRPPGPRKQGQSAACKCNPTERVSRQLRISPIGKDRKDMVQRGKEGISVRRLDPSDAEIQPRPQRLRPSPACVGFAVDTPHSPEACPQRKGSVLDGAQPALSAGFLTAAGLQGLV